MIGALSRALLSLLPTQQVFTRVDRCVVTLFCVGASALACAGNQNQGTPAPKLAAVKQPVIVSLPSPPVSRVLNRVCYANRPLPLIAPSFAGDIADMNGDGHLDVLALLSDRSEMVVLLSDGSGSFSPMDSTTIPRTAIGLAAADLNADGFVDVVTADHKSNAFSVFRGDSQGHLAKWSTVSVAGKPGSVAVADVDGNRTQDVVLSLTDKVLVYSGNGKGQFTRKVSLKAGEFPRQPLLVDLNQDGNLDLLVASNDSHFVSLFIGSGHGNFRPFGQYACRRGPADLVAADFTGDGFLDFATSNVNSDTSCVFGSDYEQILSLAEVKGGNQGVTADDLDRDGDADLIVAGSQTFRKTAELGVLRFYRADPNGKFVEISSNARVRSGHRLWVHDVDNDGDGDLIVLGQDGLNVLLREDCKNDT